LRRGSIVRDPKYGICIVGGTSKNKISIHSIESNKRISQRIYKHMISFKSFNNYTISYIV
jgi:hypothetical protein